jgi:hypothetical protein
MGVLRMREFWLEISVAICIFVPLFIYGFISIIIEKRRTNKQRNQSSIRCRHCGEPMLESDVFCENCWKITPMVQDMLNNHPDRKPDFYSNLSYKGNYHCPHCKSFYTRSRRYYHGLKQNIPITYCTNCHQYFLVPWHYELSVASPSVKLEDFIFFQPWHSFFYAPFIVFLIVNDCSFILLDIGVFFLAYCSLRLIWHRTAKRKTIRNSYIRLEQNPEYPQILVDMGFVHMMDKKYHHLSKTPVISLKDKVKTILKNAFTFD